jgi:hypothetical protein
LAHCRAIRKPETWAKRRLTEAAPEAFVAVHISKPAPVRAIEIRADGRSLMVEPGFDVAHVRAMLAAPEGRV